MLKGPIRGAILVEELIPEAKIDIGSDGGSTERGQDDIPHVLREDVVVNALKETAGLGGQAMVSPGDRVQPAECLQGSRRGGDTDVDMLFFGLPDIPAVGIAQAGKNLIGAPPSDRGYGRNAIQKAARFSRRPPLP